MENLEIKQQLEEQAKLVKEAREVIEKKGKESAEAKEVLEKMKADFSKLNDANNEINKSLAEKASLVEGLKGEIELIKKQNARFSESKGEGDVELAKKSFAKYVKEYPNDSKQFMFDEFDKKYLRTDLAASGGVLVPETMFNELIKQETEIAPILGEARVINSMSKSLDVSVRTTLPSVNRVGEGGTSSSSNSSYKKVRLEAYRNDVVVPITREELKFAAFNMENEIQADAAQALAYQINEDFLNGNGVSKSEGIMTSSAVTSYQSTVTVSDIDFTDLYKIQGSTYIKDAYSRVGKFYLNSDTLFNLATRVTGLGLPLWQQSYGQGLPPTLAGKPYVVCPGMPAIGTSTYPVFFGDLRKAYYILNAVGLEVVVDPYSSKNTGMIEYQWIQFIGGKIANSEAIVKLQCRAGS